VNWWAYQTALTNGRYDDERAARQVVNDAQHREKVDANNAQAVAMRAQAAAMRYAADLMAQAEVATDEQIIRQFMVEMADTVPSGTAAMQRAQAYLSLLRFNFPKPVPATRAAKATNARPT
jgi:hypothetical protein